MNYGIFLSFQSESRFLEAFRTLNESAYAFETFTPYAIEETFKKPLTPTLNPVKLTALIGAGAGLVTGLGMQWFSNTLYSPMDVGGRPLNSWPAFIPVTWVLTVLFAGVAVFISLWTKLDLPKPYQPIFNAEHYHFEIGYFGILILAAESMPDATYLNELEPDTQEEVNG